VIGGDGTLLSAARVRGDHRGADPRGQHGSLGFNDPITLEELYPALERIFPVRLRLRRTDDAGRRTSTGWAERVANYTVLTTW